MANGITVVIDEKKLYEAINDSPGIKPVLEKACSAITSKANSMSSGYRTGKWHDHSTGEERGGTQPEYAYDVKKKRRTMVGLVHPANYAAMKDNHEHNTLLKSL